MGEELANREPTILVVDDDRQLAELYATWLRDEYEVVTAYGGAEAIELLGGKIDVAVLDRSMPRVSGDDVLRYVRGEGYDCRVSVVTAVEPDFDIVGMGFDEYVVKPIDRAEIRAVVESLILRSEYDEKLRKFFSLASKRGTLQAKKGSHELDSSDAYAELNAAFERLREDLEGTVDGMTERDFEIEMRRLTSVPF